MSPVNSSGWSARAAAASRRWSAPSSGLDAESERLVFEGLGRLLANTTTFVIAHRLSTIRNADVILVMDRGRLVEKGTHDTLLARGGLYADLHRLQQQRPTDPATVAGSPPPLVPARSTPPSE